MLSDCYLWLCDIWELAKLPLNDLTEKRRWSNRLTRRRSEDIKLHQNDAFYWRQLTGNGMFSDLNWKWRFGTQPRHLYIQYIMIGAWIPEYDILIANERKHDDLADSWTDQHLHFAKRTHGVKLVKCYRSFFAGTSADNLSFFTTLMGSLGFC